MAEAVVKFEMLSTNPKSTVRDINHARLEIWLTDFESLTYLAED